MKKSTKITENNVLKFNNNIKNDINILYNINKCIEDILKM